MPSMLQNLEQNSTIHITFDNWAVGKTHTEIWIFIIWNMGY